MVLNLVRLRDSRIASITGFSHVGGSAGELSLVQSLATPSSSTTVAEKGVAVAVALAAAEAEAPARGPDVVSLAHDKSPLKSVDGEFIGPVANFVIDSQVMRPFSSGGVRVVT